MGKWSLVMHWGFPPTVSGKDSKLRVCCKQHYLVVIKKYSSQKPVKASERRSVGQSIYHTFYGSTHVLCAKIKAKLFFKPSCCCCFSSGDLNPWLFLSLAVARQDTWCPVGRPVQIFGMLDICLASATRQRASLMHRCVVHTLRLRSADHSQIFPRLQPDQPASSLICKSDLNRA